MKYKNRFKWLSLLLMLPLLTLAQKAGSTGTSYFSNPLFNTLFVIVILLLILILALSNALKNIIQSEFFYQKYKKQEKGSTGTTKSLGIFLVFSLLSLSLQAQTNSQVVADKWLIGGLDYFTFYLMFSFILLEIIVVILLLNVLKGYTKSETEVSVQKEASKVVKEKPLMDVLNASVDIEKEEEIMLDHDYDGIRELDNNLPPWWKYGFYLTILVAVIYMVSYHVTGTGKLQIAEYNEEMLMAKLRVEEFMRTSANNVDETTIKELTKAEDLAAAKQLFLTNCVTCHGKLGEGNAVGPNLTDNYWLHSGSLVEIFKTIKYGWPDKGMKSWKEDFSPVQMAQLASYIRTLKATNPPNPRAPQGDLYEEKVSATDSTAAIIDSTKVISMPKDSEIKK